MITRPKAKATAMTATTAVGSTIHSSMNSAKTRPPKSRPTIVCAISRPMLRVLSSE